jgi:hypothetical protein
MALSILDVQFMVCEPGARSAWTCARTRESAQQIAANRELETGKHHVVETWEEFDQRTTAAWLSDCPLQEIDAATYDEALCVLPPIYREGVPGFFMSEFTSGSITHQYAYQNGRYFIAAVDMRNRDTWIMADKIAALLEAEA